MNGRLLVFFALLAGLGLALLSATATVFLSGPAEPARLEFAATLADGQVRINPRSIQLKDSSGRLVRAVHYDRSRPPEVALTTGGQTMALGKMAFG